MRCWLPKRPIPGSLAPLFGRCTAGSRDIGLRLDPDALEVAVQPADDGYLVTARARSLVKDITLLIDRLDPIATIDQALVTLPAGASATVHVRTAVRGIELHLVGKPVLRTANDLAVGRLTGDALGTPTPGRGTGWRRAGCPDLE